MTLGEECVMPSLYLPALAGKLGAEQASFDKNGWQFQRMWD